MIKKEMLPTAVTVGSELKSKIESGKLENAFSTDDNSYLKDSPEKAGAKEPTILQIAKSCIEAKLSVIPIKPNGTKSPALNHWKPYQTRRATNEELETWFRNGNGIALLGGKISGNLEILDFDAPELFPLWCELVEDSVPNLLSRLPLVQTPSGGFHLYYRCDTIEGNQKLAKKLPIPFRLLNL